MEQSQKQNREWIFVLIGIICIIVAVIAVILFLLQGNIRTEGSGEVEMTESVVCEGEGVSYPLFRHDSSNSRTMQISVLLGDDKIDTINLVYKLDYNSFDESKQSSAENHADMNRSFSEDSMGPDSLGATYSSFDDGMQITLYAKAKELNGVTAKYFLLDGVNSYTKDNIVKKYNGLGLNCEIKDKS